MDLEKQYPIKIQIGNQMIANLTEDEAEAIVNELSTQLLNSKPVKPQSIIDKVKTWKDAYKLSGQKYFGSIMGYISKSEDPNIGSSHTNVSSEARAKSVLAYCKLSLIADVLNEGWVAWKTGNINYTIYVDTNKVLHIDTYSNNQFGNLFLKSQELAQYMITQFSDLWYDYFMITKS